jgi:elongation factor 1-alpha
MPWWKGYEDGDKKGNTLKDALNTWVDPPKRQRGLPFRMPVSGVYKIKGVGDVITGRIEQGELQPTKMVKALKKPTEITFWPSGVDALVNTIEMHHKNVPEANQGDNVGVACKGLTKDNMPKVGDVMTIRGDDSVGRVASFVADVKIQDHPGELKAGDEKRGGYTPLVLCRTAKSACRMIGIKWRVTKKAMKKVKSKKDLENAKEVEPPFVKAGDMAQIEFEPQQPFCVDDFKQCPGLGRIAVLESNSLVMLGKISSTKRYVDKGKKK